jgi:uncharacterized protein YqgC (DUF456 family)
VDIFLLILGLILCLLGIVGSFSPIIPGPITSWFGLLVIHFSKLIPFDNQFLFITFLIAALIFGLDLIIPILGLKKLGGSKKGLIGSTIGLFLGLFLAGPLGLLIGSFFGAISGEYVNNNSLKKSIKPAMGTFIGMAVGTTIKFLTSTIFLGLYFYIVYSNFIN